MRRPFPGREGLLSRWSQVVAGTASVLPQHTRRDLFRFFLRSFLPPSRCCFHLALAEAIALTFQFGDIGMVCEPVDKRDDAGGVRKDFVPFLEAAIGCHNDGAAFVATIDDS